VTPRERSRDQAIAIAFGNRVREVRASSGLTQEALAEATGLHATFISNVERGYRVPSLPTVLKLARGLKVDAGDLIAGL